MKVVGYRTVNKVNGHYYYGVRTLVKENDPYLGSGIRLKEAVKKYGKESFIREDLVTFSTFEEALEWERHIITEEMILDNRCYNLKPGGAGGSLPWTEEKRQKVVEEGLYKKSEETKKKLQESAIERFKTEPGTFTGKHHTEETKDRLSMQRRGLPGKNKGKKLNLSEEARLKLKQPKSEEVKQKIKRTLCTLTDEQIRFLKEDFKDNYGDRSKLCREQNITLDQIARIIGRRYTNRRTYSKNEKTG